MNAIHRSELRQEQCDPVTLRLPADSRYRHLLHLTISQLASQSGLSGSEGEQAALAACEAFDNAVAHAYKNGRGGAAELRVRPQTGRIVVDVVDRGRGFPYGLLLECRRRFRSAGDAAAAEESGLARMHQLVDEVAIRPNLPCGTVVTLTKLAAS